MNHGCCDCCARLEEVRKHALELIARVEEMTVVMNEIRAHYAEAGIPFSETPTPDEEPPL